MTEKYIWQQSSILSLDIMFSVSLLKILFQKLECVCVGGGGMCLQWPWQQLQNVNNNDNNCDTWTPDVCLCTTNLILRAI